MAPVSLLLKEYHCINCGPGFVITTGQIMPEDLDYIMGEME